MFGQFFQRRDARQHSLGVNPFRNRHNIGDCRRALGHRSRLVQNNGADAAGRFNGLGGFEQNAARRAAPCTDHDRGWRGQAQGARARNHQHGDANGQRELETLPQRKPDHRRRKRNDNDDRDENAADPVGKASDRRFGRRGFIHQADDLRQRRVLPHPRGPHEEMPGGVDRRAGDGIALSLCRRHALASQGGFVKQPAPFKNHAVHGDMFARLHHQNIAARDVFQRDDAFRPLAKHCRRLRGEIHKLRNGVGGFALGPRFKKLSKSDQGQNHGGGFKIEMFSKMPRRFHIPRAQGKRHLVQGVHAENHGRPRTERNQGIHVRSAGKQRLHAHPVEREIDEDDRRGQQKLRERRGERAARPAEERGERQADHRPHCKQKQWNGEEQRDDQPRLHAPGFRNDSIVFLRPRVAPLPAHGRAVAGGRHGRDDRVGRRHRFIKGNRHRVFEQIDVRVPHAVQGGDSPLHPAGTGRTRHSRHGKQLFFHRQSLRNALHASPAWRLARA